LSLGKQSSDLLDYNKIVIDRGNIVTDLPELVDGKLFKRYELTENGVSPRVIPGVKGGLHHVTGVEHDETGRPSESPINRKNMMDKRLKKLNDVHTKLTNPIKVDAPHDQPDLLIIGMGSIGGTIDEARIRLTNDGISTNHITVRLIHPFPTDLLAPYIEKAKKVIVIENNATGQLADQIKLHVGHADKIKNMLKYDGTPFLPSEIHNECKELK
jgi:2-oxoglutarate ferredoxin oxidoreductase subunit alpha